MKVHLLPEINCKVKTNRRSATAKTRHGGQSDIEVLQIESARYKWDPIFCVTEMSPLTLPPICRESMKTSRIAAVRHKAIPRHEVHSFLTP